MAETKDLPTIDELPGDLKLIAEEVGVDGAVRLSRRFGGTEVYIPKLLRLDQRSRNKLIREEFDRRTTVGGEVGIQVINEIARRPGMPCARQLQNILNAPDDRQLGLF